MIMAGIAAAGFKSTATHSDFAAVVERAVGVPSEISQSKSSFYVFSEGTN